MMQSTWHLLLVGAHITLAIGLMSSESSWPSWLAVPNTLLSAVLFSFAALNSASLEVATDAGIESASEPAIGIYAFGLAVIAFAMAIIMALNWLPTSNLRGVSNGY